MPLGTVALLFTDLVGSTELSVRIGPVSSEALRKEHFALLREASDAAGGREVKNLGDGLMLAFPSVTGALDAAVAAQRAIEVRNRRSELRFEVRMGVAIGEVNEEGGDYFGEPVVQAARLCGLAQGGQVLVTDVARILSASGNHRFASVGALALKGLPDPVQAHEVMWDPLLGGGLPLPPRLRGAPEAAYVGRRSELDALEAAWTAATRGSGGLVLLAGEPGIGKTRLASHHAFSVHEDGGTVLYGAVDEGMSVPYQPWIEAIGHYVDHAPDELLAHYVAESGPDLVRLNPTLGRRLPDLATPASSDGETERYLLLEAVTQLLRAAAADNPVLVVLDDLHWADKPTLLLLTHLHRNLSDAAVLFVGTYRDNELTPEHPLSDALASLRREPRVHRLDLGGLDRGDIVELLRHVGGQEPTEEAIAFAQLLHRDTDGNPLFVAEVLRDLLESGRLVRGDDGLWELTTRIDQLPAPASVRDVVTQRVLRLGADAQRILSVAAVIGRDFELDLLAAVLDEPAEDLVDTLDLAMQSSLLTESGARAGGLRFVHALIAQALVDDLTALRRTQLHRRAAITIEQLHGPDLGDRIGSVAGHLLAAGDAPVKTIDYARRAGQHALAALAPDEALRWFQTALGLLEDTGTEDDELRCDLLTDIGEARTEAGQPGAREELLAAAHVAERLGDGSRCARAVLAMNRSVTSSLGNTDDELVAAIEVALSLCPEPDARRARLLALFGAEIMLVAPLERRRALVDEALAIARPLDDATLAKVLVSSLGALWSATTLDERCRLVDELRSLIARVSDPQVGYWAAAHGVWTAIERMDRAGLDRSMAELRPVCDEASQPFARYVLSVIECVLCTVDGDLPAAERHATAAFEQGTAAGFRDTEAIFMGQLMGPHTLRAELGLVARRVEQVLAENPALEMMRGTYAVGLTEIGAEDEAAEILAGQDPTAWPETIAWSSGVGMLAVVANRTRDREAAQVLYDLCCQAPDVLICGAAWCNNDLSTTLGILATTLGDRDAANAHFEAGGAALVAFRAPIFLAYNRLEHGRALLELGDPGDQERARLLLAEAKALYTRHDCPLRVDECDELMAPLP